MLNDQGQCSGLLTRVGFFDFNIFGTHCNVSQPVAVVCQHYQKVNIVFTNNMSDIKISTADGFYSLQVFSSCNNGWFLVDNVCINFYHCPRCYNNINAHEQCSKYVGQLAYHILNNVTINTPGNLLAKHTKLALFWDMFHQVGDFNNNHYDWDNFPVFRYIFAVNFSGMCVNLNMSDPCIDNSIALFVSYRDVRASNEVLLLRNLGVYKNHPDVIKDIDLVDRRMWAVITQTGFRHANMKNFALCENAVDHSRMY